MRNIIILLALILFIQPMNAQIADGSTAPDFTFKDINGVKHNLYTYLNQGKAVILEVSTTWCSPCWEYHHVDKILDEIYNLYDEPGNKTLKVIMVEADVATTLSDLQGLTPDTQGDWITGTPYAICNPTQDTTGGVSTLNSFKNNYNISFYPTHIFICPDKKVYADTLNSISWWVDRPVYEWLMNKKCSFVTSTQSLSSQEIISAYPNPTSSKLIVSFNKQMPSVSTISLVNMLGETVITKSIKNTSESSSQIELNLEKFEKGLYLLMLSDGTKVQTQRIVIE